MTAFPRARFLLLATALTSTLGAAAALAQQAPADQPAIVDDQAGPAGGVEISGPGAGSMLDEIVVTGQFIPDVVRATAEVVSVLSQEDIARTGDGDIAGALQRVTGLSVVGGKYVYVRGLGERYSLALLNGSPLPSPEPLRRVVPLDLFPTSIIASTVVQKTYSVQYPGEFGGGAINLTTRSVPDDPFLSIGVGIGANSESTGQLGYTYYGSKTDWTGFDSGARSVPDGLQAALDSRKLIVAGPNFTRVQIQEFGASLTNAATNVIQRNENLPPDGKLDISAGTAFDFSDMRLGLIAAVGFDNSWRTKGGVQQVSGGLTTDASGNSVLNPDQDFRYLTTDNRIVLNALLGTALEFGEHKIRWTNIFIHDTVKQAQIKDGFDDINIGIDRVNRGSTAWFERQLMDTQLVGEFRFDDFTVDVRGTWAKSERDSPYERVNSYRFSSQFNDFFNDLRTNGTSSTIAFSELNDTVWAGGVDLGYKLPTEMPIALTVGYSYLDNKRDSVRRDFRYSPVDALPPEVSQQRPDFLLSDFNIFTYDILLTETSGAAGAAAYEAGLKVHAGYGQVEAELFEGVRLTAGVRYEDGKLFVNPLDLFGLGSAPTPPSQIEKSYWLPAGTLTWNFYEDMQLRLAASKTIARPQFRELAPQQYKDIDSDRTFFGNQFLTDSKLVNFDARYEWYIGNDERVSFAAFYKKIDKPIETVAFQQGGNFFTTFANAPRARLIGIEAEGQKYFDLDTFNGDFFAARRFRVAANYTFTDSKITVKDGDTTVPVTSAGVPVPASNVFLSGTALTGQSKHVGNLQLSLENEDRLSQQSIVLNYASRRVTNRGPSGQPDLFEKPGLQLDVVLREGFTWKGAELEFKLEARNLLGTDYQEFQTTGASRIDNNRYEIGRSFSASVSTKF